MTRTKLRATLVEQAAQLVEGEACRHCAAYELEGPIPGHDHCWQFVRLARAIRKRGERN